MAVGMKKVTTQILNQAIKTNFESVKDGTGLPLTQSDTGHSLLDVPLNALESITDVMNSVSGAISNLAQSVKDIVSNIIKSAKEFLKPITNLISKIITAVSGIVKNTLSNIMRVIGIPMKWLGNIFNKAMTFIKDLLSPLGGSLKSKTKLKRNVTRGTLDNVGNIVTTGTIMGLMFGKIHSKDVLNKIITSLKKTYSPQELGKALKLGLNKHPNMPNSYFETFRDIDHGLESILSRELRALFKDSELDSRLPYRSDNLDEVFREFEKRGLSKASGSDMSKLARNKKIKKYISSNRVLNSNIPYSNIVDQVNSRKVLTDKEKLTTIKYSSGLIDNKVKVSDPIEDYMSKQEMDNVFKRFNIYDGGLNFKYYTNQGERYNQTQILGFNRSVKDYKPQVRADLSYPNEIDQLGTMVGINNMKLKDNITYSNFNGYSKKENIIENNLPPTKGPIAPQEDVTNLFEYIKL